LQGKYQIGNAQTIGSFEFQSNYFSTLELFDSVFGVLADGTIDHENGRRASIIATETSMLAFRHHADNMEDTPLFFDLLTSQIIKNIQDKVYLGKTPYLSFTGVYIQNRLLRYFTVGENCLFIFDGQALLQINDRAGELKLKKNDTVCLVSKGVYQALNEVSLIKILSSKKNIYDKAQIMIEAINTKNLKNASNSTVLLIKGGL